MKFFRQKIIFNVTIMNRITQHVLIKLIIMMEA